MTTLPAAQVLKLLVAAGKRSRQNVDTSDAGKLARTYNGALYASKAESCYAQLLDIRKMTGDIADWGRQYPFQLVVDGVTVGRFTVDFIVIRKDGPREYVEVKGFQTETYKFRLKVFKALYPNAWLTVIDAKDVQG